MVQFGVAEVCAPQLGHVKMGPPEIRPLQARIPEFCASQICITQVQFLALAETAWRSISAKNRENRLDVRRRFRFMPFRRCRVPRRVVAHLCRQYIRDRPVVLRPILGNSVESVDASESHLDVWLSRLQLSAQLTCSLNKAVRELSLSVNVELVLGRSQITSREEKTDQECGAAGGLHDCGPNLEATVRFVLQESRFKLQTRLRIRQSGELAAKFVGLPGGIARKFDDAARANDDNKTSQPQGNEFPDSRRHHSSPPGADGDPRRLTPFHGSRTFDSIS